MTQSAINLFKQRCAYLLLGCVALAAGSTFSCQRSTPSALPAGTGAEHAAEEEEEDVPITEADVELPANFAAAVERIDGYRRSIREAIANGHPGRAHRPLDELEIVLDKLPEIARDSGVPKRRWEQVVESAQEISDRFNELHAAIDEHRTVDYASVAEPIETAIRKLADVQHNAPAAPERSRAP